MRVVPTSIDYSGVEAANYGVSSTSVTPTLTTSQSSTDQALISCAASGFTAARMYGIRTGNGANQYLGFTAEL